MSRPGGTGNQDRFLRVAGPDSWAVPQWIIPGWVEIARVTSVTGLLDTDANVADRYPYLAHLDQSGNTLGRWTTETPLVANVIVRVTWSHSDGDLRYSQIQNIPCSDIIVTRGDILRVGVQGLQSGDLWLSTRFCLLLDPLE